MARFYNYNHSNGGFPNQIGHRWQISFCHKQQHHCQADLSPENLHVLTSFYEDKVADFLIIEPPRLDPFYFPLLTCQHHFCVLCFLCNRYIYCFLFCPLLMFRSNNAGPPILSSFQPSKFCFIVCFIYCLLLCLYVCCIHCFYCLLMFCSSIK